MHYRLTHESELSSFPFILCIFLPPPYPIAVGRHRGPGTDNHVVDRKQWLLIDSPLYLFCVFERARVCVCV